MEKYGNKNGDSGVSGFEIGTNFIRIEFSTGSMYEYTIQVQEKTTLKQ
ncbi:hypothetical protein AB4Y90_02915 [Chryseobacterium sp. 2TAF14]